MGPLSRGYGIIVNSQYSSESSYVSYTALLFPFNWGYSFFWVGFWGGIPTGVPTPLSPSCFCERSPFPPYSPLCWHWTTGCSSPHSSNDVRTYNYHCIGISPYCYRDSRALTASSRYASSCCPGGSFKFNLGSHFCDHVCHHISNNFWMSFVNICYINPELL